MTTANIKINTPVWGTRSVGVAEYKICDENYIEILTKDKNGARLYPHTYMATREELMKGEVMHARGNVKLRVVPISSLHVAS